MPLRRVTEAAYERHRQKLAESASPVTAAHAAAATPAPAASSAKVAAAASTAPTPSLRVSAAGAPADSTPALLVHASSTAAQPQAPPTANPVAPTPTLFHFECLRCGFSSKQSSKTVSFTRATCCLVTSDSAQVCRRCRWVPPQGSQIRHDASDASKVNSLAGAAALDACAHVLAPFYGFRTCVVLR
jgi:hypothetical protein